MKIKNKLLIFSLISSITAITACNDGANSTSNTPTQETIKISTVPLGIIANSLEDKNKTKYSYILVGESFNAQSYSDAAFSLGITGSVISGVAVGKRFALAGVTSFMYFGLFGAALSLTSAFMNFFNPAHKQTANAFATLFYDVAQLQYQMNELQNTFFQDENLFYQYVVQQQKSETQNEYNQFYNLLQPFIESSENGYASKFFNSLPNRGSYTIQNIPQSVIIAATASTSSMEAFVDNFNEMFKTVNFGPLVDNISGSVVTSTGNYCEITANNKCFIAIQPNNVVGETSFVSLLAALISYTQTQMPALNVGDTQIAGLNAVQVFDSHNNYVVDFTYQAAIALQAAYQMEFYVNYLNYNFGKQNGATLKNINIDTFNTKYQLPTLDTETLGSTYFTYNPAISESQNESRYYVYQRNLLNAYLKRVDILSQTATNYMISDQLDTNYQQYYNQHNTPLHSPLIFNNQTIDISNDQTTYQSVRNAYPFIYQKLNSLPVLNNLESSGSNKLVPGYFYVFNGLTSVYPCGEALAKLIKVGESITPENLQTSCPSIYSNYNTLLLESNVYDGSQFSYFIGDPDQDFQPVIQTATYPQLGTLCDLRDRPQDFMAVINVKTLQGQKIWGFNCQANFTDYNNEYNLYNYNYFVSNGGNAPGNAWHIADHTVEVYFNLNLPSGYYDSAYSFSGNNYFNYMSTSFGSSGHQVWAGGSTLYAKTHLMSKGSYYFPVDRTSSNSSSGGSINVSKSTATGQTYSVSGDVQIHDIVFVLLNLSDSGGWWWVTYNTSCHSFNPMCISFSYNDNSAVNLPTGSYITTEGSNSDANQYYLSPITIK